MHSKIGIACGQSTATVENNMFIDNDNGMLLLGSDSIVRYNLVSSPFGAPYHFTYQHEPVYFASSLEGEHEGVAGITMWNSSPTISHNIITHNPNGIVLMGASSPTVSYNTINNCSSNAIFFEQNPTGNPSINYNNIYGNAEAEA